MKAWWLSAIVLPAMPAYYHKPGKIEDLIDFVVGKVLDIPQIEHDLYERWKRYDQCKHKNERREHACM